MPARNESRIRDIKETASDAVEIIRELRTPEVQETLDKVKVLTDSARDIMTELKSPEWVRNIDNIRMISQSIDDTSARMEAMVKELKDMPIVSDASSLVRVARIKLDSLGNERASGDAVRDLRETAVAVKEMLQSLKALMDEVRLIVAEPRNAAIIKDVSQAARDVSSTIQTLKEQT